MQKLLTIAVLCGLTGCTASNEHVLESKPVVSIASERDPADLEQCLVLIFAPSGMVSTATVEGERRITFGSAANTIGVISIIGERPTHVELRQSFAINKVFRNKIRACAENKPR